MAQQSLQTEQDKLCCSICLDLMRDPATIPCGHSYCLNCIRRYWDEEQQKESHSCPQCRQAFLPRPALVRSTVLAELVEEKRRTGPPPAADGCSVPSAEVECDFCSGEEKQRAVKSCLQCLVSCCQQHLQPHLTVAALKKHQLVEPSRRPEDSVCPLHNEPMKIFCRTDQSCICYLCLMDEHRGHQTLSAAAEASNKRKELEAGREEVRRRIQERQQEVDELQQAVEDINWSADGAVRDGEEMLADVKRQIRARQKSEVEEVGELQERLEQEVRELRSRAAVIEELSQSGDHVRFLQSFCSLARLGAAANPTRSRARSVGFRAGADGAVSELRGRLQELLTEEGRRVPLTGTHLEVLGPQVEPQTRQEFLEYACPLTLDKTTAHRCITHEGHLGARNYDDNYLTIDHPDKFWSWPQILCAQSLTGRCYWEVEWINQEAHWGVFIAVSYKDVYRKGDESAFGNNDKSWALACYNQGYEIRHDWIRTPVPGPVSSRIGVYLDHSVGSLSFYRVSDNTMSLLHRVQTTFTRPLCPGFGLYNGASANFCDLWTKKPDLSGLGF